MNTSNGGNIYLTNSKGQITHIKIIHKDQKTNNNLLTHDIE
jgi:hypothetical protein